MITIEERRVRAITAGNREAGVSVIATEYVNGEGWDLSVHVGGEEQRLELADELVESLAMVLSMIHAQRHTITLESR